MGAGNNNGREAARVLMVASDQIDLALQQSQPSVDALGEALHKLATMLAAVGSSGRSDALLAMRAEMLRARLAAEGRVRHASDCRAFASKLLRSSLHCSRTRLQCCGNTAAMPRKRGRNGAEWSSVRMISTELLSGHNADILCH